MSGSVWATIDKSWICKELQQFAAFVNRQLRHSLRLFLSLDPHMMPPLWTHDPKIQTHFSAQNHGFWGERRTAIMAARFSGRVRKRSLKLTGSTMRSLDYEFSDFDRDAQSNKTIYSLSMIVQLLKMQIKANYCHFAKNLVELPLWKR